MDNRAEKTLLLTEDKKTGLQTAVCPCKTGIFRNQ